MPGQNLRQQKKASLEKMSQLMTGACLNARVNKATLRQEPLRSATGAHG